jgi:atypical dual specificity phosphatase
VVDGKIMASVYPKEVEYLRFLKENEKIMNVINLAESPWPEEWSRKSATHCNPFPIIDMSAPTVEQVLRILEVIDRTDGPTMVHCAAGIGRTGTLIALYLVHHGMDPRKAISLVRKKRNGSIQTSAQEGMIYDWAMKMGDRI